MAARECWNCRVVAHQSLLTDPQKTMDGDAWHGGFRCNECGALSVGAIDAVGQTAGGVKAQMLGTDTDLLWLPRIIGGDHFADVPDHIAGAASEATLCHSAAAYRASILLARAVVEAVAKDKGITSGTLAAKIDQMAERGLVRDLVKDTAHEIRHLGNDMARGDFVEEVSEDDSDDVLEFMRVVLQEVYQIPARLDARKATRAARKRAGTSA